MLIWRRCSAIASLRYTFSPVWKLLQREREVAGMPVVDKRQIVVWTLVPARVVGIDWVRR